MSDSTAPLAIGAAVLSVLLVLDFALTVALMSAAALSRVALHRLSAEANGSLRFLDNLREPGSSYRIAAHVARQFSLLGGVLVVGYAGREAGWPYPFVAGLAVVGVVGVLLIETLAARALSLRNPKVALRWLAPLLRAIHVAFYPIAGLVAFTVRRTASGEALTDEEREEEQEEEVEAYFEVGEREGILEADEGKMMRSIVDLGDTLVREIMTPRTDIEAIPLDTSVGEARRAILTASHSRVPVFRESIDNIVGVLHLRDLVRAWGDDRDDAPITAYVRPAYFVPETQTVDDLLAELRTRTNMALVVDEYGGIAGLVTLEDILEEIVGDIRDEHDAEEELIEREEEGSWAVSGLVHVSTLEEMFDVEIEDEREFDTVGGLVVSRLGRVPQEGEALDYAGLHITVIKADPRRVYKVRIRGKAAAGSGGSGLGEARDA